MLGWLSDASARLTLEARQTISVRLIRGRQDLQRDVSTELRVVRAVDLAHSADTQEAADAIRAELRSSRKGHVATAAAGSTFGFNRKKLCGS